MDTFFLLGRIIVGGFFMYNGINHFVRLGMMTQYTKMKGVPMASLAVAISGLFIILGGLSVLLGAYPVLGVVLLAAFLIPTSFMMHNFWAIQDPQMKMGERINFLKNLALLGAVLMFLAIPVPWPVSVGLF